MSKVQIAFYLKSAVKPLPFRHGDIRRRCCVFSAEIGYDEGRLRYET